MRVEGALLSDDSSQEFHVSTSEENEWKMAIILMLFD